MASDNNEIPSSMNRLVIKAGGGNLASCKIEIESVPVPVPAANQVLIKVAAAPVNPSDYHSWERIKPEDCPRVLGNEGCGVVVKIGEGFLTSVTSKFTCSVGTKVGFVGLKNGQGSYSEYVVADVFQVFPMPSDLPIEDAASFFVNPYTAIAILDTAKSQGSNAFVHTAAASQLGQMLVKLAPEENMEVINVVRRDEQAELLKKFGAKHVVVTGNGGDSWKEELRTKMTELKATVAFDAIAGQSTGDLVDIVPNKGTVYVYGGLAGLVKNVNPMELIYHEKILKGFFLKSWIEHGGPLGMIPRMLAASRKVNAGLSGGWSSSQFQDTTMEKMHDDIIKLLGSSVTGKKLRIRFDA